MTLTSAIDHASTNKPGCIKDYNKVGIEYSDHKMISLDVSVQIHKLQDISICSRDMRKLRATPYIFLNRLASIEWEKFKDMNDVDLMENCGQSK